MKLTELVLRLWLALSTPNWYIQVISERFSRTLLFSLVWLCVFGAVTGLVSGLRLLPVLDAELLKVHDHARQQLPDDLELVWNAPQLQVFPQQVALSMPENSTLLGTSDSSNLVTLFNQSIGTDQLGEQLDSTTLFVGTQDYLAIPVGNGSWNDLPWTQLFEDQSWTLGKQQLLDAVQDTRAEVSSNRLLLLGILTGVGVLRILISNVLLILLYAALLSVLLYLIGISIRYLSAVAITTYVAVVLSLAETVVYVLFDISIANYTMYAFWAYTFFIINAIRKVPDSPVNRQA